MTTTVELTTQQQLNDLLAEQASLTARISELAKRAASGDAEGTDELPMLANRQSELHWKIEQTESRLLEERARQSERDRETQSRRFHVVIAEAQTARSEFLELFRQAALALGRYCALVEEALHLARSLSHGQLGTFPHHAAAINELKGGLNPYEGWEDVEPIRGYGWNLKTQPMAPYRRRTSTSVSKD